MSALCGKNLFRVLVVFLNVRCLSLADDWKMQCFFRHGRKPSPKSDPSTGTWEIRMKLLPDLGFSPHSLAEEMTVLKDGTRQDNTQGAISGFVLCFIAHLNSVLPEVRCLRYPSCLGITFCDNSTESIPLRSFPSPISHLRPMLQKDHWCS